MSTNQSKTKATKRQTKKTPIAEKPATGKNKHPGAGKTAPGSKSSSRRAQQPAKRTTTKKKATPKKKKAIAEISQEKKNLIQRLIIALKQRIAKKKGESNVGKVYRGRTKYIDKETKKERSYVVVLDDGKHVSVAKLKSIKIFDENGRNADKALVEINATRYGLEKRTGVDFQTFDKNRMSGKPLKLEDKDVFPEDKECFKLGSHDTHNALEHTGKVKKQKRK